MFKALSFIGTLIVVGWDDILEFVANMHHTGVSWGAVITALILWSKLKRNKRLHEQDKRMEAKVDALLTHLGVEGEWSGELKTSSQTDQTSLKKLSDLYYKGTSQVNRRRRKMPLSKGWIAGLIGYVAYFVKQTFGYEVPVEMVDKLADVVLLLIPIISMILNMRKGGAANAQHYSDTDNAV